MLNISSLLKIGELSHDIINLIVVIGLGLYFAKHFREWLEYLSLRRLSHIENLKKLSENISNKNYSNAYKQEEEYTFFALLTKREIFSSAKRNLLLKLLEKEVITKKDIEKYSYHFTECKGKLHIKISITDYFEIIFLRFTSIYMILVAIFLSINAEKIGYLEVTIIFILIILAIITFSISFKLKKLKRIMKTANNKKLYINICKEMLDS